jgi:4a-hydroxytetrahydrobiopterin dehydratase
MVMLYELNCVRPSAKSPKLTEAEIEAYLSQLPGWKLIEQGDEKRIQRVFKFKDFGQALSFTNQIGALAEQQDHHPALLTEWGRVTVTWWTHTVKGLHPNDFIMAAKTDREYTN